MPLDRNDMRYAIALLLLCGRVWGQVAPSDQKFSLNIPGGQGKFSDCGTVTRTSPNLTENLSLSCFQSVNNLYFDDDYSLSRRNGYTQYNLTPCQDSKSIRGIWPFNSTNGVKYAVMLSSGSMFYSTGVGDCNMINLNGTNYWGLSQTAEMQCVQSQGYLWCADGVDPPFRTDIITSSQTIAGAPTGPLIGAFRNRILIGGVPGNLTQLYLSGELNGLDWTLPAVQYSTSPAVLGISGVNDGSKMNCLMGEFQNQYLVGRDYDIYALSGYDLRDFTLRKISNQIGCIEPKSVQELNNQLIWISKRGVESLTGTQINPISYYIRPTINQIIAASGNSRSQLFTSQGDFDGGQLCPSGQMSCVNDTISPGNIVPSSFTILNQNGSDFSSFTTTSTISTSTVSGVLTMSVTSMTFSGASNLSGWTIVDNAPTDMTTQVSPTPASCAPNATESSGQFQSNPTGYTCGDATSQLKNLVVTLKSQYGVMIASQTYAQSFFNTSPVCSTNTIVIDPKLLNLYQSSKVLVEFKMQECVSGCSLATSTMTNHTFTSPLRNDLGSVFQWNHQILDSGNSCTYRFTVPTFDYYPASGTYLSQSFDTKFSTPTFGVWNVSISSDSSSAVTIKEQVSSDNITWDSFINNSLGVKPTNNQKEYFRYKADFTTTTSTKSAQISLVNLAVETTAYYITPAVLVSTPTSWGTLQVNSVPNGGSFTIWVSTGETASRATAINAPWIQQSPNSQIVVVTTTTYVAARILFSVDVATEVPTLNDITFNWNAGASRPPTASLQYNDRYYLFYTTSTAGTPINDHVAVYDYNGKWTFLDDINAYSATIYLNQPFIGDANSSGKVFQLETGQSDNGGNFTYSFQTGDLSFGSPAQRKAFKRLYLFVNAPSQLNQGINLACNYNLDGSNTKYSLQSFPLSLSPEQTGYAVAKFQFPTTPPVQGHWINLSCNYTGNQGPVKVYGLQLVYDNRSYE